jgi:hypothetical protein
MAIIPRAMRWAEYVARMEATRNIFTAFVGKYTLMSQNNIKTDLRKEGFGNVILI